MTYLVCGGAGFIASHFAELLLSKGHRVVVLDSLTYAGHRANVPSGAIFVKGNIRSRQILHKIFRWAEPDALFNFAAESHVCRSIEEPESFIDSNIRGTYSLLQESLLYFPRKPNFRFVQVSTDEVFGDLGPTDEPFTEDSPYRPHSPYASTKAAADHLVRSWHHTYGLPTIVTHCSNNYGTRQHPEKLIPKMIRNAITGQPCELHGDGTNVRDWIHVEDHCDGVWRAYALGQPGRSYCFGGNAERTNLEVVRLIMKHLELRPETILFGKDRPGNDRRYAINDSRARNELQWERQHSFDQGLRETIDWYANNQAWCELILNPRRR